MIKYLRCTTSGAASNGLGTKTKSMRGAADIGLDTTIKCLRRTARPGDFGQVSAAQNERRRGKRPGQNDQVPATHNERRRGQRPEPVMGINDMPIHLKRPVFAFFCAFLRSQQAERHNIPRSVYTRARHRHFLFPVPNFHTEF
jgi:hypothetical protein